MKKIVKWAVLCFIFGIVLMGCATEPTGPITFGSASTFEEAVQECYKLAAETLFYSSNGKTQTASYNRVSGPNEIAGVCTDYSLEFAYYWNVVNRYDVLFGKAYLADIPSSGSTFYIRDFKFAKNGSSSIRATSGSFEKNANDNEADGVYRDAIITKVLYTGKPILHFNQTVKNHMWVVIKYNDEWYDCEPTWWETLNKDYVPYKLLF